MIHSIQLRAVLLIGLLSSATPILAAPFTDNLDGTVTDDATGLVWDKCSWGQTWNSGDNSCSPGSDATTHTWADALARATAANTASHRGRGDWRLPNRTELESLLDLTRFSPAIDNGPDAFPNTPWDDTPTNWYWTSTSYALDPDYAWFICFNLGYPSFDEKTLALHVRLVRGGQPFAAFDSQA